MNLINTTKRTKTLVEVRIEKTAFVYVDVTNPHEGTTAVDKMLKDRQYVADLDKRTGVENAYALRATEADYD